MIGRLRRSPDQGASVSALTRPTCYLCREAVRGKQRTVGVAGNLCHELCAKRWLAAYQTGCALCEKPFDGDADEQVVRDGFLPPSEMVLYHDACWSMKVESDTNEGLYGAVKEGWLEQRIENGKAYFKMTEAGKEKVRSLTRRTGS